MLLFSVGEQEINQFFCVVKPSHPVMATCVWNNKKDNAAVVRQPAACSAAACTSAPREGPAPWRRTRRATTCAPSPAAASRCSTSPTRNSWTRSATTTTTPLQLLHTSNRIHRGAAQQEPATTTRGRSCSMAPGWPLLLLQRVPRQTVRAAQAAAAAAPTWTLPSSTPQRHRVRCPRQRTTPRSRGAA